MGLVWALGVAMLGWALLVDPPGVWSRGLWRGLGLAGVAGGQFVFLCVCANRWIPDVSPALRRVAAIGLFAILVGGLVFAFLHIGGKLLASADVLP